MKNKKIKTVIKVVLSVMLLALLFGLCLCSSEIMTCVVQHGSGCDCYYGVIISQELSEQMASDYPALCASSGIVYAFSLCLLVSFYIVCLEDLLRFIFKRKQDKKNISDNT